MTKKTILISTASLTLVVTGLLVGLNLVSQNQNLEKKAASSTGTATFKMTPSTTSLNVGDTVTVSGQLNTGNTDISAYQIVAYLSYTTTTPPALINTTEATNKESALTCLFNSIQHDSTAKKYTIAISCVIPITNPIPYTTSNSDRTMFVFDVEGSSPGTLTLSFNNSSTTANSASDASDILATPNGGSYTIVENSGDPTPAPTPTPTPTPTSIPTPTPTLTPTPTPQPGQPNSCNGTCGSNYNCQTNLFCYQGFCRNPFCKTSATCVCPTPTPTPKSTSATPSQTPLGTSTPTPTPTPQPTAIETFPFPSLPPLEHSSDKPVKKLNFLQQLLATIANFLLSFTGQK